jgi:hypothetical protein
LGVVLQNNLVPFLLGENAPLLLRKVTPLKNMIRATILSPSPWGNPFHLEISKLKKLSTRFFFIHFSMEEKKNFKKINPYDLWLKKEILITKSLIFP